MRMFRITAASAVLALLTLGGFPEPYFMGSETEARRWSRQYRTLLIREEVANLERVEDLGTLDLRGISWVIVGGESGPGARQSNPTWFRRLRDQCRDAGVGFHFKQWGDWFPLEESPENIVYERRGKARAGRLLDGETWAYWQTSHGQWLGLAKVGLA